jgi:phosphoribosylformimino-5-aminoimidazole carboxamide ribonucleotide (ProFAR) isomerase
VQVAGWEEDSGLDLAGGIDLVRGAGVRRLLVTATDRDGTLSGPRVELIERVLEEGDMRVIAAGGIGSLEDVDSLLSLSHSLLEGVVVGRALYEGNVELSRAVELARSRRAGAS